ncbi:MAG: hypothetical protein PHC94_14540 [Methylobacter sp.]|jgi:hypothetical protein|nr:hypothetical protein [Methylococcales bacterium]MDD5115232.1 hypothetical protein [Methylobacter sp.]
MPILLHKTLLTDDDINPRVICVLKNRLAPYILSKLFGIYFNFPILEKS